MNSWIDTYVGLLASDKASQNVTSIKGKVLSICLRKCILPFLDTNVHSWNSIFSTFHRPGQLSRVIWILTRGLSSARVILINFIYTSLWPAFTQVLREALAISASMQTAHDHESFIRWLDVPDPEKNIWISTSRKSLNMHRFLCQMAFRA